MKVGYVVPVRNEEESLPDFLASLAGALDARGGSDRRVVFVPNGCTDRSEEILHHFCAERESTSILSFSGEPGIVGAFRAGVKWLGVLDGVGKLDADTCLEPESLQALEDVIASEPAVWAAYCEPTAFAGTVDYVESVCGHPVVYSARLYLEGRASLYRGDPFDGFAPADPRIGELLCEDIFLSALTYARHGPSAIRACGSVLFRPPASRSDFGRMLKRTADEVERVRRLFPDLGPALDALERSVHDDAAVELLRQLEHETAVKDRGWSRLESTKGGRPHGASVRAERG